jgi:hypothetical protein
MGLILEEREEEEVFDFVTPSNHLPMPRPMLLGAEGTPLQKLPLSTLVGSRDQNACALEVSSPMLVECLVVEDVPKVGQQENEMETAQTSATEVHSEPPASPARESSFGGSVKMRLAGREMSSPRSAPRPCLKEFTFEVDISHSIGLGHSGLIFEVGLSSGGRFDTGLKVAEAKDKNGKLTLKGMNLQDMFAKDWRGESGLKVITLQDGFAKDWNDAHPLMLVEAADFIVALNGRRGSPKVLLEQLSSVHSVTIRRHSHKGAERSHTQVAEGASRDALRNISLGEPMQGLPSELGAHGATSCSI